MPTVVVRSASLLLMPVVITLSTSSVSLIIRETKLTCTAIVKKCYRQTLQMLDRLYRILCIVFELKVCIKYACK